ncbi:MAG: aminotransferase class I/II-fold pyridoxal phosphate-dependent enzyme [Chitinispirillales bacterium]|jgi:aspartate/methionine/tyrosine aminotransferase|nr:aminotransferase class I/II-fold pyridoxal phosphate-dependent enzyme [Chitinispirillales bacterium]
MQIDPDSSPSPQAAELNYVIKGANPYVFDMLSPKGRRIFFPTAGILAQTAQAAGAGINATIGTALDDAGAAMQLSSVASQLSGGAEGILSYAPNLGKPEIRSAWRGMLLEKNPSLRPDGLSLPIVTSGLTHGLSAAAYLFLDGGDAVITPDLFWENYNLLFAYAYGATLDTFPMFNGSNGFNAGAMRDKLFRGPPGKRIVVLNFPNNPTGYTPTVAEAKAIVGVIVEAADRGNNIVALIDDAYFGLVFEEGIIKESIFSMLAGAHERVLAVKIDGPTKEDYAWGIRVGFVTFGTARGGAAFYKAMESKLGGSIRGSTSSASNVGQTLLLNAYRSPDYESEKGEKYRILLRRYTKIKDILNNRKEYAEYIRPLPFNSGYFLCLRVLSGKAEEVRLILLEKYDTGVIALGDLLRVAFSSTPYEQLEKLFDNIYMAAREVSG